MDTFRCGIATATRQHQPLIKAKSRVGGLVRLFERRAARHAQKLGLFFVALLRQGDEVREPATESFQVCSELPILLHRDRVRFTKIR